MLIKSKACHKSFFKLNFHLTNIDPEGVKAKIMSMLLLIYNTGSIWIQSLLETSVLLASKYGTYI